MYFASEKNRLPLHLRPGSPIEALTQLHHHIRLMMTLDFRGC